MEIREGYMPYLEYKTYYRIVGKKTGNLEVNGKKTEGTLVLRWITHRFDAETFIVTLGIIVYFVAFFKILYRLFS